MEYVNQGNIGKGREFLGYCLKYNEKTDAYYKFVKMKLKQLASQKQP